MAAGRFDYIIVGAGSAGCVLAERLTRDGRLRVLLIEAGGTDRRFWIKVPLGYAFTFFDPKVNWRFSAAPDPGLNGRGAYWPRGKVLGGSSSINAMAYLRGLPHDFDDWARAGATGWDWAAVRPVFEALESNDEIGPDGARRLRGAGPVRVSDLRAGMHPFSAHFLDAAREMGWPVADDLNAAEDARFGYLRSTVRDGVRWSAADAFLRPAMRRANLAVVTHALVERVLIEEGRAVGVRYRRGDRAEEVRAGGEVILSAGAIGSPQILQLSGIGPAGLLARHGIAPRTDLRAVGQGLQDHLALTQYFRATVPTLNQLLGNGWGRFRAGLRYVLARRGPLGVPVNQCSGFLRSGPGAAVPDVQVYANPASYRTRDSGPPSIDRAPGFLLSVQPCRPTSRGEIAIASDDPAQAPLIRPNSLATEEDRRIAIAAGRLIGEMARRPALARLTEAPIAPDMTGLDEAGLLEAFRARAGTVFHPCCTCRMGRDAGDSVLDARLRVHGIGGLRVIDASAFPNVTSGNINAPVLMLAARGAGMVLEDAGRARG